MRTRSRSLFSALALAAVFLSPSACSDKDLLDSDLLFDAHDPPTPNKLRGVYQIIVADPGTTTEIRLRFTDHYVVGAVKCVPKNPKFGALEAGAKANMGTNDLDSATGSFSVDALTMSKREDMIFCEGGLVGDTYDFKVEELRLTLTTPRIKEPLIYGKIGD